MFSSLSNQFIERICHELKKPEHVQRINFEIVKPLLQLVYVQVAPIYCVTLLLILAILIINSIILYKLNNMRC